MKFLFLGFASDWQMKNLAIRNLISARHNYALSTHSQCHILRLAEVKQALI